MSIWFVWCITMMFAWWLAGIFFVSPGGERWVWFNLFLYSACLLLEARKLEEKA
jgi:hypothetical protein